MRKRPIKLCFKTVSEPQGEEGWGGLALEGSSRSAASRPFCGRRNTALLLKESEGPSGTGNLKSGTLPKWGRLKHGGRKRSLLGGK